MGKERQPIESEIISLINDQRQDIGLGCNRHAQITPDSRLKEDLGFDSLALIELCYEIGDKYGVPVPDEVANEFRTVQDITAYVEKEI